MRLLHPTAERLAQGAIFNCVPVFGYENCKCSGIVLTARCDLEHNKHSVVNFLPIVRFTDWSQRSLCQILARTMRKELAKEIDDTLIRKGISLKLRATFPLADIIETETAGAERKTLLEKVKALALTSRVEELRGAFCPEAKALIKLAGKKCERLLEDLVHQRLSEYYFLETIDIDMPSDEGFVILSRYVQTIDSELAKRIVLGIASEDAMLIAGASHALTFAHEPICLVTGVLRSPDVEHLAQHFATLFVRIGLEDHAKAVVDRHCSIVKVL